MQFFLGWLQNVPNLSGESRALMLSVIASVFWRWQRRRSPCPAQTPAWTTSPDRQVLGAGNLHRHFPTRDALLEAVYRTEAEKRATAERKFAEVMPPIEALRAWMLLFVDYIATKKTIALALNTLVGSHAKVIEASYAQTTPKFLLPAPGMRRPRSFEVSCFL